MFCSCFTCPFGTTPAARFFAWMIFTYTFECLFCSGLHDLVAPIDQIIYLHDLFAYSITHTRLIDMHMYLCEIIKQLIFSYGPQCIKPDLRIVLCADRNTFSILQVDDMQRAVTNDDRICRATILFDPFLQIELLFNFKDWIRTVLFDPIIYFDDIVTIAISIGIHILIFTDDLVSFTVDPFI